jgi:hypothetical protein
MKTYLNELRGQVRGTARLRRKVDSLKSRVRQLELALMVVIDRADGRGIFLDDAASVIGWRRQRA